MRNQHEVYRRTARGMAVAVPRDDIRQKFVMIGAYVIGSAITALWLAYLPNVIGPSLDAFDIVPQHLTENSVNRLQKGDRMVRSVGASFDARWSAFATVRKPMNLRTTLAAADVQD